MTDELTILRARGRKLCKTIRADGSIVGYDNAKTFDLSERSVSKLADFHTVRRELATRRDCAVVRGGIADPSRTRGVRRLLHEDRKTGDPPTLLDVPRRWLALDFDGLTLPKNHPPDCIFSCGIAACMTLPREFRGVGFLAQATGSHGLKAGAHLRLWCWLSRPATGAELAVWMRGTPHLDRASFSAAQLIFTAGPIFEPPMTDPLPQRLMLLDGPPAVRVPAPEALRPPPAPPPKPMPDLGDSRCARYAFAAMRNAAMRISTAPVGSRHATILREARSLARLVGAGMLGEAEARRVVSEAAAAAGKNDSREIEGALAWGAAHPSPAPIREMHDGH